MMSFGLDGLRYYAHEWEPEDDFRVYQASVEKLDRVESIIRGLLRKDDSAFISRVLHIAIDRAVGKKIRLVTAWWKDNR